jgi:hypothetical protein
MRPIVDPRHGDIEDDVSSPKSRTLVSLAGSLLVEISLPKLILSWVLILINPALTLGLTPILVSAWCMKVWGKMTSSLIGIWPLLLFAIVVALGWFWGGTLFRLAESGFWSLNSLTVEPGYATCRESLRHLAEQLLSSRATKDDVARARAAAAVGAGLLVCALAVWTLLLVWPSARWVGDVSDLAALHRLAVPALANSVVLVAGYVAVAALVWSVADATMAQPVDLAWFQKRPPTARVWRIAHLSDIHVVGEQYGFRIESGRAGPRGNQRFRMALAELEACNAKDPLDVILITGDITDAGRSVEWAEFLDALACYPGIAGRVLVIPGNHDLNVVDRANPARLDLPTSPNRSLRRIRTLSAMGVLQGERVRVVDRGRRCLGERLADVLESRAGDMATFADSKRPLMFRTLKKLWTDIFPMVLPPDRDDGLGIMLLNSNADTHFSFTNALGMISAEQIRGIQIATEQYPRACWIIALHHHVVEYPRAAKALSERIGTALINGNWFVRRLRPLADKAVLMHGHRHTDWIGKCANLVIVSAPSPVMEATDDLTTSFYIHTLAIGTDRRLRLLDPYRITLYGQPGAAA